MHGFWLIIYLIRTLNKQKGSHFSSAVHSWGGGLRDARELSLLDSWQYVDRGSSCKQERVIHRRRFVETRGPPPEKSQLAVERERDYAQRLMAVA